MTATVLPIALALFSLSLLLNLYRLLRGPDIVDRILGLDTLNVNAIAVIVLGGIYMDSSLIFEAALLIALMGFVSTVAMTKYLVRGDVIE
ncbi:MULTISPECIES: K+/H+ antiporter subunit F [Gammaproteobacteria]|jgi:multicomponent K+:H+ antiporter subunit F|uniref:K+/H+ antiporter subunit F n=2 Tax=Halomonadaceae TaxID=28256 RepID=A0A2A2F4V5_9GAMM|nr:MULTISPECIES: K+/H+ antiporter subunit F [Gammaproteobacteria]KAA8982489.1 K+/H+ antiporter subunit F [Halospina sp. K52047b]MYL27701.1 K+/H+ antiporter subunit F [Halomonas utahensis]MYL75431.1 K+/H+ antiporter subunit F [Halomonas sp. 22501_18_FS]PAU79659.1 K+/H+ antiporter subunit F [Halovibrio salipaludis]